MLSLVRAWLVVLTLTGKRREKLRRLMGKAGRISYRILCHRQTCALRQQNISVKPEVICKIFTWEQGDLVIRETEEAGDGTSSQDVESVASSGGGREDVLSVVSRGQPIRVEDC